MFVPESETAVREFLVFQYLRHDDILWFLTQRTVATLSRSGDLHCR